MMKKVFFLSLFAICPVALAGPDCTNAEPSEWMDKDAFQQTLKDQGYEIKVFKKTDGNCYEIYGWDKEKRKVEIYFNPVNGDVVKEEIEN